MRTNYCMPGAGAPGAGARPHTCTYCNYVSGTQQGVRKHERDQHPTQFHAALNAQTTRVKARWDPEEDFLLATFVLDHSGELFINQLAHQAGILRHRSQDAIKSRRRQPPFKRILEDMGRNRDARQQQAEAPRPRAAERKTPTPPRPTIPERPVQRLGRSLDMFDPEDWRDSSEDQGDQDQEMEENIKAYYKYMYINSAQPSTPRRWIPQYLREPQPDRRGSRSGGRGVGTCRSGGRR